MRFPPFLSETSETRYFSFLTSIVKFQACSVIELYGYLDSETRDWIDGLFSKIFREMSKSTDGIDNVRRYICFDGDVSKRFFFCPCSSITFDLIYFKLLKSRQVDALWIESMNSLMDDNKLLTLANGERIRLNNQCALLFEVGNLQFASPATVSRTGMVYVDPKNLGFAPYWQRWLNGRPESEREKLNELYEQLVPDLMAFVHEGIEGTRQQVDPLKTIVMQTELNMLTQLCMMLNALLPHTENDKIVYDDEVMECVFTQCLYFSLGASLMDESRKRFDEFFKKLNPLMGVQDSLEKPANTTQCPTAKPTLYEYFFDLERREWIAWEWIIPEYLHNPTTKYCDILVPTVDTLRTEWVLRLMNQVRDCENFYF